MAYISNFNFEICYSRPLREEEVGGGGHFRIMKSVKITIEVLRIDKENMIIDSRKSIENAFHHNLKSLNSIFRSKE